MPFLNMFDITTFVNRGVEMLKANELLRSTVDPATSLVTDVLAQEAPIDQSPNKTIIPVIYVYPSKNFIRRMEYFGRDTLDEAGARYYHLEIYNVIIVRGIDKQAAQVKAQEIGEIVREVYQKNLRMATPGPTFPLSNPIAAMNEVVSIPFVLRSDTTNIQAINVITKIEVPIHTSLPLPIITLLPPNPEDVGPDDPWFEPGATAVSSLGADLTSLIEFGPVPPEAQGLLRPGTYFRTYDVKDPITGARALQVKRTIRVF